MNMRWTLYLLPILIGLMVLLFVRNAVQEYNPTTTASQIAINDVRGSEVVYRGKSYTLSFEQQQGLVELLNRSVHVTRLRDKKAPFSGIEEIVIYRFGDKPLKITPVDIGDDAAYFRAPQLHPEGFLMDTSAGTLWTLLQQTYDK